MTVYGETPMASGLTAAYRRLLAEGLPHASDEQLDAAARLLASSAERALAGEDSPWRVEHNINQLRRIFGSGSGTPGGTPSPQPSPAPAF
jgi:hypothetical protein